MGKGLNMEAVITKEWAIKAVLHGACRVPKVGQAISRLSTEDLIWVEIKNFVSEKEKMGISKLPIWVLSGYGYGYGDGSGSGSGYGSGDGSGDGLLAKKEFLDLIK